jgi:hypothetical protein
MSSFNARFASLATDTLCSRDGGIVTATSVTSPTAVVDTLLSVTGTLETLGVFSTSGPLVVSDETPAGDATGSIVVAGGVSAQKGMYLGGSSQPGAGIQFYGPDSSVLNFFSESTARCNLVDSTFSIDIVSIDIKFSRIGSLVCVFFPFFMFTIGPVSTILQSFPAAVPSVYRPSGYNSGGLVSSGAMQGSHVISTVLVGADGSIVFGRRTESYNLGANGTYYIGNICGAKNLRCCLCYVA